MTVWKLTDWRDYHDGMRELFPQDDLPFEHLCTCTIARDGWCVIHTELHEEA